MDKALYSCMSGYFGHFVNVQKKNGLFPPNVFFLSVFIVKIMLY